jgi:hypothetical protein
MIDGTPQCWRTLPRREKQEPPRVWAGQEASGDGRGEGTPDA